MDVGWRERKTAGENIRGAIKQCLSSHVDRTAARNCFAAFASCCMPVIPLLSCEKKSFRRRLSSHCAGKMYILCRERATSLHL